MAERARNEKGQLKADDPSTPDVNEAWVGGTAPSKSAKKEASTNSKTAKAQKAVTNQHQRTSNVKTTPFTFQQNLKLSTEKLASEVTDTKLIGMKIGIQHVLNQTRACRSV